MIKLPSKKVLSAFVLMAAFVAAAIIAFGGNKSNQVINITSSLVAGDKISIPDNPNWQNELSGISQDASSTQMDDGSSTESNLTDAISTSLMSNMLALKQSGNLDATSAQDLINQTINYVSPANSQTITESQLNIIPDNGIKSITDYGENLGAIIKNNNPKGPKEVLALLSQIVQSNDAAKVKELDAIINIYQNIENQLLTMPVPNTFIKAHLGMTNSVYNAATSLSEIEAVASDPIKGLVALQMYQNSALVFSQAMAATQNFIEKNNVLYKQGSGGYYLLNNI